MTDDGRVLLQTGRPGELFLANSAASNGTLIAYDDSGTVIASAPAPTD